MKKLLTVMLVVGSLLMTSETFSQAGFRLGVKGGLNFASLQTDVSTDGSTGYHAGAFATIKITKFAIQPEILYSTQTNELNFAQVQELRTSYVNIPVMVKFYLIQGINLQAGPQFGFTTLSEVKNLSTDSTEDLKDELSGSDVSLAFGAGVDLPFGLSVTARYNLGLSDIAADYDIVDIGAASDEQLKNQVFQVSVGYAFIKTD